MYHYTRPKSSVRHFIGMALIFALAASLFVCMTPTQQAAAEGEGTSGGLNGKPRMGVTVSTVKDTNGQLPRGAYVVSVEEGSPAEQAGLLPGDIIVEVNGEVVTSVSEEVAIVSELKNAVENWANANGQDPKAAFAEKLRDLAAGWDDESLNAVAQTYVDADREIAASTAG